MPATPKTPRQYSTNPSTAKARRRKMSLSDAEKIEEAAKLADYKAMLHARKNVQQDPDFARASESEKSTMLEMAMRQTMEKRRARGQDTMSKMAAYRAGQYREAAGPRTRVPISAFLRNNGFVPPGSTGANQRGAAAGGSNSQGAAGVDDMEGVGNPFAGTNGIHTPAGGPSFSPGGRPASAATRSGRRNVDVFESPGSYSPPPHGVKSSPGTFAFMSPEPMQPSVEGDVSMTDAGESLARLQTEMGHLRAMCQNLAANNKHIREVELGNVEAEMGMEKSRVQDLEVKVKQLEGVVHALQHTSLGSIVDRVNDLENTVGQLEAKVGGGCDAEVANMREVMGGLKNLLDKVGGFA